MDAEIVVVPDPVALAQEAAQRFSHMAKEAVASRGRFSVALSGGSTPAALYNLLAEEPYRGQIPWGQAHLFWGDERCVPVDDPASNYRLVRDTLIAHVPIPSGNIYRVHGEWEPEAAARAYTHGLHEFFCGPWSRFDLVLLGLGGDGHTASLFPGSDALDEAERLAVAVEAYYQDRPAHRVTLTLPSINAARQILFLVTGSAKAQVVQAVLEGPGNRLPAKRICPTAGRLTWLLDTAAAGQLGDRA
jgi:6-phosphogluconolactonase